MRCPKPCILALRTAAPAIIVLFVQLSVTLVPAEVMKIGSEGTRVLEWDCNCSRVLERSLAVPGFCNGIVAVPGFCNRVCPVPGRLRRYQSGTAQLRTQGAAARP